MRYREPFTLYKRAIGHGKAVFYYRFYDGDGTRTGGRSTGQINKTLARRYVVGLIKAGRLDPAKEVLFDDYAKDWWKWGACPYLTTQVARGKTLSRKYADVQRGYLRHHVLPTFGKMKIASIRPSHIEKWIKDLGESAGLSHTTINHCFGVLRIMLAEARRLQLIPTNPIEVIRPIIHTARQRQILTLEEARLVLDESKFSANWQTALSYGANRLASCTGMRLGEVLALKVEDIKDGYVRIEHSWDPKYGIKCTKTGLTREIPIGDKVLRWLARIIAGRSAGYVFSISDGESPVRDKRITLELYGALERIGITDAERKRRNLTFHAWRHFFNSTMRGKIADAKLQRMTGHQTLQMVDHYTHWVREDFLEVLAIQEQLGI